MEITGGTITSEGADLLHAACRYPQPDWEPGSTEPWIIDIVAALCLAHCHRNVVEFGGYKGACSQVLAQTLGSRGGGNLIVVEYDPVLADGLRQLIPTIRTIAPVTVRIMEMDSLKAIALLPDRSVGFVWLDDSHDAPHVAEELQGLIPKMVDGGLICFHDVCGHYNLRVLVEAYGGYVLDLPRASTSGGLGLLEIRPSTRTHSLRIGPKDEPVRDGERVISSLALFGFHPEERHLSPVSEDELASLPFPTG